MATPEARARANIDALLAAAGWHVCGTQDANIDAAQGVAIREFPFNTGFGQLTRGTNDGVTSDLLSEPSR